MINAPIDVLNALESGSLSYANLVTVNLGDAYNTGSDFIIYLTDYGHPISFGGNTYTPDNNLIELEGISRKASTGSDAVDIVFGVTDANLIDVVRSERYINKPTNIDRVIMSNGGVVADYSIPIRTAWGLSHSISGDLDDRTVTLTIDSTLGDLDGDNGWYAINASHHQRYPDDDIMKHGATVMTEEQQKKYTTDFSGVINSQVKPPALPKIYGYRNAELIPICMLKHRKTHTAYRHYFTTMIYCVSIGECEELDVKNLKKNDGEAFNYTHNVNTSVDGGGWSVLERTPSENETSILDDPLLAFWRQAMDSSELARLDGMYGKGLTLLFVNNRNRDDWLSSPPKLTMPVKGAKVYDPRLGPYYPPDFVGPVPVETSVYSRNPALQYADYLRSIEYGAGKRGIPVNDSNIIELADHFDQIPDSIGNDGINTIHIDVQIDTAQPLVDNMNIWMEGLRLYTSDYYGTFNIRVETISPVAWSINEEDLVAYPDYESGEFTKRLNQLTYTIKQLVPDTSEDAEAGDLVEVDVEATFPADGTSTHLEWLEADGGINNFDSEQLSYVTDLEQAYYWTMVDARISRQPRELTITTNPKGWLSEVGDVVEFSSEIMDMNDTLWRIDEVSEEDEGSIELKLIAYADEFYTPDPDSIPEPVAPAQPPTGTELSPVSGLGLMEKSGLYYLNWVPLSSQNVSWYAVEIRKDNAIFIDEPKVAQPPLLLESLTVGEYDVTVTTVGINDESAPALMSFTVELPVAPSFSINVETFDVEISLSTPSNLLGVNFELKISETDNVATAESKGTGSTFTLINLLPTTKYYVFARTINIAGKSGWSSESFTTLDGQKYADIVGELPLVDLQPIKDELETIPRAWDSIVEDISLIFGDAIGGKERIVNTKSIEHESATRQQELARLEDELAQLDGLFPIKTTSISDNAISTPKLQANSVVASKIVSNAIYARHIIASAITSDKISANAITSDKIAALAIISDLIAANAIVASKIAAGAITADKIAAGEITGDKIAALTITSDKLISNLILGVDAIFKGRLEAARMIGGSILSEGSGTSILIENGQIRVGVDNNHNDTIISDEQVSTKILRASLGTYLYGPVILYGSGLEARGETLLVGDVEMRNNLTVKGVSYLEGGVAPFTGSHEGLISINHARIVQGDILVDTGVANIENISNAICFMALSSKANQRAVSGVFVNRGPLNTKKVAGLDDSEETTMLGLTHDLVSFNALGEGAINVCGEGGNIEVGDLITSSSMAGKGMKQLDQDNLKPYTVAQSRQSVTFESPSEVKQIAVYYRCG